MNHKGGLELIKVSLLSWMQHRGFFFLIAFGWMVPLLVYLFIWSAAAGDGEITGLNRDAFMAYYLILIPVNQLTYAQTNWTVGDNIRIGQISSWLLRPVPTIYHSLASEGAGKVVMMAFALPVTGLLYLFIRPTISITMQNALLFIPALLLAWALRFFWGYWLASLAFWTTNADSLLGLQDTLVFLFGGQVAPVSVLPAALGGVARLLPFRYMLGFPVEVLMGHLDGEQILTGFITQAGWMVVAVFLQIFLWRRGVRQYSAVGG
jgi:ABC-2 type transport system permease protein